MKTINNTTGGRPLVTDDLQYTYSYSRIIAAIADSMRDQMGLIDGVNSTVILEGCDISETENGSFNISEGHISNSSYEGLIYVPAQTNISLPWRYNVSTVESEYRTFYNDDLKASVLEKTAIETATSSVNSYISLSTPRVGDSVGERVLWLGNELLMDYNDTYYGASGNDNQTYDIASIFDGIFSGIEAVSSEFVELHFDINNSSTEEDTYTKRSVVSWPVSGLNSYFTPIIIDLNTNSSSRILQHVYLFKRSDLIKISASEIRDYSTEPYESVYTYAYPSVRLRKITY